MDELKINDLRTIQYSSRGVDWSFAVGQYIKSIDSEIQRIYLDDPYLMHTGIERFVIDVFNNKTGKIVPWKLIKFSVDGGSFVVELKL